MKKILLISHSSDATGGGEEDYLKLLKYLYGRYYIIGIFPKGEKTKEYIPYCNEFKVIKSTVFPFTEFKVRGYISYFVKNLGKIIQIYTYLAKFENIDVCYINSSVCFLDALIVSLYGIPYVLSIKENIKPKYIKKLLAKFYCHTAVKITTLSEFLKNEYLAVCKNMYIDVIYSALEEELYLEQANDKKSKDANNELITLLNIGSIFYQKGQHILIDAVAKCKNLKKIKVKIIGEAKNLDYFNFIKERIYKNDLRMNIELCGKMEKKLLISEICKSDGIIITSFEEGQSLVLLEGLFLNKPIITTNVGIVPEVIKDGLNGIIVEINNVEDLSEKIDKIVENEDIRKNIGKHGFDTYMKYFSFDKSLSEIEKLIIEAGK